MTRASYDRAGLRLRVQGHAGAGEYGKDIVCAGASILMLTLEAQLRELKGENRVSIMKKPGMADISCCPAREQVIRCRDLFETIFLGYQLLENMYPENVKCEVI